jgi:nitrate reductase delta subunit
VNRPAVHQAAALLLSYPDDSWPGLLRTVRTDLGELPGPETELLARFCAAVDGVPPLDLAARYVRTFDRSRRRTLHLTYYTDGDTRRRGASLARLKALYRAHGWELAAAELPDFLPAVLEFAARCPRPGEELLTAHRPALELLGHELTAYHSPYADVLGAVRRTLPGPAPADRAAALQLARHGPPAESVGLDPFPDRDGPHQEGTRR